MKQEQATELVLAINQMSLEHSDESMKYLKQTLLSIFPEPVKVFYGERNEKYKPLAVLDYIPEYKTKVQYQIFIESREQDIKVLKDVIKQAKKLKKKL